ncbi:MAG: YjjG family noncanonical pyrimidine nucleotidase [Saprospiraceae bacterium]|nr:YjjG family noncanonical pyrimidine nucleotidase [Saprospiraceae bacterium]
MPLANIRWLLLDLDNTLLDFTQSAKRALSATYRVFGVERNTKNVDTYREINNKCWLAFESGHIDVATLKNLRFHLLVDELNLDVDPNAINQYYLRTLSQQIDPMPGAHSFLKWSSKHFSLVLATNGFQEVQRPRIASSGMAAYFDHIVISEEIGFNKPAPGFFEYTFEKMGAPKKTHVMIIGDNLGSDIQGGSDYGIRTCWFNPEQYSPSPTSPVPDLSIAALDDFRQKWKPV